MLALLLQLWLQEESPIESRSENQILLCIFSHRPIVEGDFPVMNTGWVDPHHTPAFQPNPQIVVAEVYLFARRSIEKHGIQLW